MIQNNILQNARYIYQKSNEFNKKYKYMVILSMLLRLIIPVFATFIPTVVVYLIINGYNIQDYALLLGGIVLVFGLINYINTFLSYTLFFEKTVIRANHFFEIVCNKSMTTGYENMEFDENREKLMKAYGAIDSNSVGIERFLVEFPVFITSIFGLLAYSAYILSINYLIVIVLFGMMIINLLLNAYARSYEKRTQNQLNLYRTKLKYYQDEAGKLINAKDIRIYKLEEWFYKGIKRFTRKYSNLVMKQKSRYSLVHLSDSIFATIRNLIAYSILVTMVLNGTIDVSGFTFMMGIIIGYAIWLNQLSESFGRLREVNISVNHFIEYIKLDDRINTTKGEDITTLMNEPLSIEFRNVSFTYPNAIEPTIKNLNLFIKPGEKIALVGVNGAGKTTIVKLLTGLYQPTSGEILINGIPMQRFNTRDYYKLFGVIFQDINTLPFSITVNISGQPQEETDYEKLNTVLIKSGLHDKIQSLENKEDTYLTQVVDEKGIMLSGGELQKLMLARALYKDSPILVLDEPTAALDPLAEQALYLKYNDLTKNKTSIFISHRLSSTQFCTKILYLENGVIDEEGNHDALIKKGGKYANMFTIQSQYYKENEEGGIICEN